jgi:hypothetical protein
LPGQEINNFEDEVFEVIVDKDEVCAAFKNNRHSNFKRNYVNTLGEFENGNLFSVIRNWHAVIALIY